MKELLSQFENDIMYDAGGFDGKVRRSTAGKQIVAMGRKALPVIVAHLEDTKPSAKGDVSCAWAALMARIGMEYNLDSPSDLKFGDISTWIAWAKSIKQE
jgi:hypothetical protein